MGRIAFWLFQKASTNTLFTDKTVVTTAFVQQGSFWLILELN